jgi:putative RNA 2'-phosphotransferase
MKTSSKFLSLVLRHKPEEIRLELDAQGWAEINQLLKCLTAAGRSLARAQLEEIVATSDKKRFILSEDGTRIRAAQGHSIEVDLDLTLKIPPEFLYHGTSQETAPLIYEKGLLSMRRQYVHLSEDDETAITVGRRHGEPVVLKLPARQMAEAGRAFYQAENGVWLTNDIPEIEIQAWKLTYFNRKRDA